MIYQERAGRAPRRLRIRWTRVGLLVAIGVVAVALGYQSHSSSTSSVPTRPTRSPSWPTAPIPIRSGRGGGRTPGRAADPNPGGAALSQHRGALGEAGGDVPAATTVFDEEVPGVAKLDRDLLAALRRAATDAGGIGVDFVVTSGWRSPAYQEQLLQGAIAKYGSEQEAARWVATPETSPHVSGDAVDIEHASAMWLSEHGAYYGLCQIYANEPWHYELRSGAAQHGCPAMYADPTHDPRLQR